MKIFDKLKIRLKNDLLIDADSFERCYPGHIQRSLGAWVWSCRLKNGSEIGSIFSAAKILKAKKIFFDDYGTDILGE